MDPALPVSSEGKRTSQAHCLARPLLVPQRTGFLRESPIGVRCRPLLPAAAARGQFPWTPAPKCLRGRATPQPQVRQGPHRRERVPRSADTELVRTRPAAAAGLARSSQRLLSPNSEVTAPGAPSSGGCGGRGAPAPIEWGKERLWARFPLLPHPQLGRAASSRPPAPTALARPRGRQLRLLQARARGRRWHLPRRVLPSPSSPAPRAQHPPLLGRLRRLRPPHAVTWGDSALATFAAAAPAPARPSDADPGVGRCGAGAAAAGPGLGLLPPPPPRNPEGGPFTRQLGRTERPRVWAAPKSPAARGRRGQGKGVAGRREGTPPRACSPAAE